MHGCNDLLHGWWGHAGGIAVGGAHPPQTLDQCPATSHVINSGMRRVSHTCQAMRRRARPDERQQMRVAAVLDFYQLDLTSRSATEAAETWYRGISICRYY